MPIKIKKIKDLYVEMSVKRQPYLDRFREYSRMTLKYLFAEDHLNNVHDGGSSDQHGWSSIGGEYVDYLANKIVMTLYPPQKDFFSYRPTYWAKKALLDQGVKLSVIEQMMKDVTSIAKELDDVISPRVKLIEIVKHLLVSGNMVIRFKRDRWDLTPLSRYVVLKDLSGNITTLIILEKQALGNFTAEQRRLFKVSCNECKNMKDDEDVELYTRIHRKGEQYHITQSVFDSDRVGEKIKVPVDKLPWRVLGWSTQVDSSYSSSKVELHAGEFNAYEILKEAVTKQAIIFSDIKQLLNPGAFMDLEEIVASDMGSWHYGREGDITVSQAKNVLGATYITDLMNSYEKNLGRAFLFQKAARRDAERVTTYELRLDAIESETTLGGFYSRADNDVLKPYARFLLDESGASIILGDVVPVVTTGIDALGKLSDLDKLVQWSEIMQLSQMWPQELQQRAKMYEYSLIVANKLGLDITFLRNDDEFEAYLESIKQSQQESTMVDNVSKGAGTAIGQQVVEQGG